MTCNTARPHRTLMTITSMSTTMPRKALELYGALGRKRTIPATNVELDPEHSTPQYTMLPLRDPDRRGIQSCTKNLRLGSRIKMRLGSCAFRGLGNRDLWFLSCTTLEEWPTNGHILQANRIGPVLRPPSNLTGLARSRWAFHKTIRKFAVKKAPPGSPPNGPVCPRHGIGAHSDFQPSAGG